MAGWVYKPPPAREFGGHLFLRSVTDAHAAKSSSFSIITFHPGGHGNAKKALHHEVLLIAAFLPADGVTGIFSRHHRGKWMEAGTYLRTNACCFMVFMETCIAIYL